MSWKSVYENWDKISEADREEIKRLFSKLMETGKLDELLRREFYAKKLYEEKVSPVKELTEEEKKRLEDVFKATLLRELGRIPRDVMAEFRVEMEAIKTLPYERAEWAVEKLAKDIAEREKRPPLKPAVPAPAPPPAAGPTTVEVPRRLIHMRVCPECGASARFTTMTVYNPSLGEFEIRGRYVCSKCGWVSEWESVGFLL